MSLHYHVKLKMLITHMQIMSLHYLVKLKMLILHVLPLSCWRKKLQKLFHLNCGLQSRQIWIYLITACREYCKRRCTKHASLIWTYWWCHWRAAAAMKAYVIQLGSFHSQLLFRFIQISEACFVHLLAVFSTCH